MTLTPCGHAGCERNFADEAALATHRETLHGISGERPTEIARFIERSRAISSGTLLACVDCARHGGVRSFADEAALTEHAAAVHTFDDIRNAVRDEIEDGVKAATGTDRFWVWVADIAPDWVVWEIGENYFRASYTIDDKLAVTLGAPEAVISVTSWQPKPAGMDGDGDYDGDGGDGLDDTED